MSDEEKVCGTCRWHGKNEFYDWKCVNIESDYCTDWTGYNDSCDCWEERE